MTAPVDATIVIAAVLVGLGGAALAALVWRPLPPTAARVRPYANPHRIRLGQPADPVDQPHAFGGPVRAVLAPMIAAAGGLMGRLVDQRSHAALLARLDHAAWYRDLADADRVAAYRRRRLAHLTVSAALGGALGLATASGTLVVVLMAMLAGAGLLWSRGELEAAVAARRDRMTTDLYTVDQHLAQLLDSDRSVDDALQRLTRRGRGPVIDELAEVLVDRRAGRPLDEALQLAAEHTAEPHAARTYRTLATAAATGGAVTDTLRKLAVDVRTARRHDLRRRAERRRQAMILPVLLLILPLLILIAAPIPTMLQLG